MYKEQSLSAIQTDSLPTLTSSFAGVEYIPFISVVARL